MSSEPDYNFNSPSTTSASGSDGGFSLHLPFALLSAAIAILFVQQTISSFKTKTALNEAKENLTKAIESQKGPLDQAAAVEKRLTDMIEDLLLLAKTDDLAKQIVTKYGIQQGNPGSAGSAEPAK
jgi:hypothetical protein